MLFMLGVDAIKSVLYGRLGKVTEPGPGYIHLPASVDEKFCAGLTSEKAMTKYVRGRATVVWEVRAKNLPQEPQDCWNYAYAAFLGRRGPDLLNKLARSVGKVKRAPRQQAAEEPLQQQQVETAAEQPPQPEKAARPPKRRGWVTQRSSWFKR
jgi:phage terminase large subunit GpA-like protein